MLPYGIEALRGFGEVILQEKEKAPEKGSKTVPAFCRVIDRKLLEERITETEQEAPALQIDAGDAGVLEFSVFSGKILRLFHKKHVRNGWIMIE